MQPSFTPFAPALRKPEDLITMVENRTVISRPQFELNVFETHLQADNVRLQFDDLVFTSMLRGKKVMHLKGDNHFEYYPGESVILGPGEEMLIDFPEAKVSNPTQCLALAVNQDIIRQTITLLNENYPKSEDGEIWDIAWNQFHFRNTDQLADTLSRLVKLSFEPHQSRDLLANLSIQELIVRLLQTQARKVLIDHASKNSHKNRLAYAIEHIQNHLSDVLCIDKLSEMACMSKANFHRAFKRELGLTPVEYIQHERIKLASQLLKDPALTLTDVCFRAGFNNTNYFFILFKKLTGTTPGEFRKSLPPIH
ncbi:MAG TPA: AraC family transcriptional regulator [Flavobacteriales bacterium]|nr:AraC family transcriptional regulator [Flavobacteriales bacterium]